MQCNQRYYTHHQCVRPACLPVGVGKNKQWQMETQTTSPLTHRTEYRSGPNTWGHYSFPHYGLTDFLDVFGVANKHHNTTVTKGWVCAKTFEGEQIKSSRGRK